MKYFFGFVACVLLIIGVFILVLQGFTGKKGDTTTTTPLVSYANTNTEVRLTVDGPINADQTHSAYRITIGRDQATLQTLKGYQGDVIDRKQYDNNQEAYASFLRALDFAGFQKGKKTTTSAQDDERGVCANGSRYLFEIIDGSNQVQRYWGTSCGGGTFQGNSPTVRQLFARQIPDFPKATSTLQIK